MAKATTLDNLLLNAVLRNVAYVSPTAVYAAAMTTAPTAAGGGVEVSGGSYARQAVTFGAAASGSVSNSAAVAFPVATAAQGTVVGIALYDNGVAGGNLLHFGPLATAQTINAGNQLTLPIGNLVVSEA